MATPTSMPVFIPIEEEPRIAAVVKAVLTNARGSEAEARIKGLLKGRITGVSVMDEGDGVICFVQPTRRPGGILRIVYS